MAARSLWLESDVKRAGDGVSAGRRSALRRREQLVGERGLRGHMNGVGNDREAARVSKRAWTSGAYHVTCSRMDRVSRVDSLLL